MQCSGQSDGADDGTEGEKANISQMAGVFVMVSIAIGISFVRSSLSDVCGNTERLRSTCWA